MNLDIKDRKILYTLDLNARMTFQEIGKKCLLSKETTIHRITRLEKKGIIERYNTLINFAKLGYTGYAVYNRLQHITPKKLKEIISGLENTPNIYWVATMGGRFDIAFGIIAKNIVEFNRIHYEIRTIYGAHLVDETIAIRAELRQHQKGYLTSQKIPQFKAPYFGKEQTVEEIDNLDATILSYLSTHARMPIIELAARIHKPASTTALRIKRLEEKGIIQGYLTYIRAQKYGMQSYRVFLYLAHMNEQSRIALFEYANNNPNMILAIETVGEWNFEITLEVESPEILQTEITLLRDRFSNIIKKTEFVIMFEDDLVYDPYPLKKKERKDQKE